MLCHELPQFESLKASEFETPLRLIPLFVSCLNYYAPLKREKKKKKLHFDFHRAYPDKQSTHNLCNKSIR